MMQKKVAAVTESSLEEKSKVMKIGKRLQEKEFIMGDMKLVVRQ